MTGAALGAGTGFFGAGPWVTSGVNVFANLGGQWIAGRKDGFGFGDINWLSAAGSGVGAGFSAGLTRHVAGEAALKGFPWSGGGLSEGAAQMLGGAVSTPFEIFFDTLGWALGEKTGI